MRYKRWHHSEGGDVCKVRSSTKSGFLHLPTPQRRHLKSLFQNQNLLEKFTKMPFDSHIRRGHPIMFGLLIFFGIIEGAITTWLTVMYNNYNNYDSVSIRDRIRLLCFTSWWTVFFSFIYLLLFLHSASTGSILTSVASHLIFLAFTWLLWTAGVASLTAGLGGGLNCANLPRDIAYCSQLNAAEAFGWIEWLLTTLLISVVFICGIRSRRRGEGARGQLIVV